jgi:hypothetical protein
MYVADLQELRESMHPEQNAPVTASDFGNCILKSVRLAWILFQEMFGTDTLWARVYMLPSRGRPRALEFSQMLAACDEG